MGYKKIQDTEGLRKRIADLYSKGLKVKEIGKEVGLSYGGVFYHLKVMKVPIRRSMNRVVLLDNGKAHCGRCGHEFLYSEGVGTICKECWGVRRNELKTNNVHSYMKTVLSSIKSKCRIEAKGPQAGTKFDLTIDDVIQTYEQQKGLCFYTDSTLQFGLYKSRNWNTLSLDKIIPEKGYVKGNVVFCTRRVNTIKNNMTLEEMKEWTPGWYERILTLFEKTL